MAYYDYNPGNLPKGMDSHYQPLHKQASELQEKFHVRMEDRFNPISRSLQNETANLVQDIATNRTPQELEERVRAIQGHLMRARGQTDTQIINQETSETLSRAYGRMRSQLQGMPAPRANYQQVSGVNASGRRGGYTPYQAGQRPGTLPDYRSRFRGGY